MNRLEKERMTLSPRCSSHKRMKPGAGLMKGMLSPSHFRNARSQIHSLHGTLNKIRSQLPGKALPDLVMCCESRDHHQAEEIHGVEIYGGSNNAVLQDVAARRIWVPRAN